MRRSGCTSFADALALRSRGSQMGSLVTFRRHCFPLLERRILDRFGFLPLLGALRPAHFGSLVARVSYCVIRNCEERAFLLGETENVILNPIFQAENQRPGLDCFGCERLSVSRNPGQRLLRISASQSGMPLFDLQDRANPEVRTPASRCIDSEYQAGAARGSGELHRRRARGRPAEVARSDRAGNASWVSSIAQPRRGGRGASGQCQVRRRPILVNSGYAVTGFVGRSPQSLTAPSQWTFCTTGLVGATFKPIQREGALTAAASAISSHLR